MSYLVMHDGIPDGQVFNQHEMRRELIRAKFHGWYCTIIEVDESFKNELNELILDLE